MGFLGCLRTDVENSARIVEKALGDSRVAYGGDSSITNRREDSGRSSDGEHALGASASVSLIAFTEQSVSRHDIRTELPIHCVLNIILESDSINVVPPFQ